VRESEYYTNLSATEGDVSFEIFAKTEFQFQCRTVFLVGCHCAAVCLSVVSLRGGVVSNQCNIQETDLMMSTNDTMIHHPL